ncbi:hypothetical protein [Haloplanus rubicundus]|uniref:Peptidase M48 domain-containing protein n=1 Tax=Haloplanus rubicundus TaxID=1547898 RepID=A0A345E8U8_9EURY|nr:hypothetical protein [Haloplanus rubicundus]AXG08620.1 hypothetical protein DU484_01420 [Haloplanus rubicundus]
MSIDNLRNRIYKRLYRLESWFQDRATRLFAWLYRRPVESRETYETVGGDEVDAYMFSNESMLFGQHTPFGTILLNKHLLSDVSGQTETHVVQHELSHRDRNSVIRGLWWGIIFSMAVGIAYGLYGGLLVLLGVSVGALTKLFAYSAILVVTGIIVNRLEETKAELDALHALGEGDFRAAHEEISTIGERSVVGLILGVLFYPNPETTISLYNKFQQIGLYGE